MNLVRELERTWAKGCERRDFRLVHYSLQSNHVHLIVEALDAEALGRGMNAMGSRLAKAVNRVFGRSGVVLADRYHHVVLRTPTQTRNALRYVLLDARHHAQRASGAVRIDPASSGRWFRGWKPAVRKLLHAEAEKRSALPAVADPHTWLLREGWRRGGGLIDPTEAPG